MKLTKLALSLLVGVGAGCTTAPSLVSTSDLPNCFDSNYDKERGLFTIKTLVGKQVNQQCLLTVGPRGDVAPASGLAAGTYKVYLAGGGGGGAGGTLLGFAGGGGGGGGGAGAVETSTTVILAEGVYKLTIGAGGPGGTAGSPSRDGVGGGTGWAGSPSNIVRVATGEVVAGTPGADTYVRLSRGKSERSAGKIDAHGGSGPGQTSGGGGARTEVRGGVKVDVQAGAGESRGASGAGGGAGFDPVDKTPSGAGGGGGATSMGQGGTGGGEVTPQAHVKPATIAPERGSLGSGGGGGEGSSFKADPGASGGHGYIAFRPM